MIYHRPYSTYSDYVSVQGTKARELADRIRSHDSLRMLSFMRKFRSCYSFMLSGKVLCLGARTGCEVFAWTRLGFKGSMGIDLHPLHPSVLRADWHYMPFADHSFENIYTNSLDHCLDFPRLVKECKRVIVTTGSLVVELDNRYPIGKRAADNPIDIQAIVDGRSNQNPYNSMWWDSIEDIISGFTQHGFEVVKISPGGRKYSLVVLRAAS